MEETFDNSTSRLAISEFDEEQRTSLSADTLTALTEVRMLKAQPIGTPTLPLEDSCSKGA